MMIELDFRQYLEKLGEEKKIIFPTEHVYEGIKTLLLFFRSREKIDYYTLIEKSLISEFGGGDLEDFKMYYCYNSLPIKESPVWIASDFDIEPSEDLMLASINKLNLMDGEDIVKESKSYAEFLEKYFDNMEKKVLIHVTKIGLEKKLNKNFGEFLSQLFSVVHTLIFSKHIKKFIKSDLITGKSEAESELNIKIGFNKSFQQKLDILADEQINGYTINGKKWFGIKGVTTEIQQKIISVVQDGINKNKSITDVSKEIKDTFGGFSEHRANMISRTETNKIINEGLLIGYKESGLKGNKTYKSIHDGRTSEICERLSKKYGSKGIPLDDLFIDDVTNKAYLAPPAHVFCRCRLLFLPE